MRVTLSYLGLLKKNQMKLAKSSNIMFGYIDDVISLNNSDFGDYVDHSYHIELEIKDTTDKAWSVSNLDLHLEIGNEIHFVHLSFNRTFLLLE